MNRLKNNEYTDNENYVIHDGQNDTNANNIPTHFRKKKKQFLFSSFNFEKN